MSQKQQLLQKKYPGNSFPRNGPKSEQFGRVFRVARQVTACSGVEGGIDDNKAEDDDPLRAMLDLATERVIRPILACFLVTWPGRVACCLAYRP